LSRWAGFFSGVFLALLLAFLPLRLALGWSGAERLGLRAERVEGTVWRGRLHGASFAGAPLGDVRLAADPLGLLMGGAGLRFATRGELEGRGRIGLRRDGLVLRDADLRAPIAALAPSLPLQGALQLTGLELDLRGGGCRAASGAARAAPVELAGATVGGLSLSGEVGCRDGMLSIPLTGGGDGVSLQVATLVSAQGRYRATTRIRATNPGFALYAASLGLERGLDGYSRIDAGRLGR
jgi:general secretion pathway protein N